MDISRSSAKRVSAHGEALALATMLSSVVALSDILRSALGPYWYGGPWSQWGAAAVAFLATTLFLWFLIEVTALIVRGILLFRLPPVAGSVVGALISGPLFWNALCVWADVPLGWYRISVTCALVGVTLLAGIAAWTRISTVRSFGLMSLLACFSAVVCAPLTAIILLFHPDLATLRVTVPAAVAILTFIELQLLSTAFVRGRLPWFVRVLSKLFVAVSFPALLFGVSRVRLPEPHSKSPNILLITADAMRAKSLSLYGGPVPTPALQSLADRGHLFERAYSVAPWTVPSFCGIFSSKYPPGITPNAPKSQQDREQGEYDQLYDYWVNNDGTTFLEELAFKKKYLDSAFIGNDALFRQDWLLKAFVHPQPLIVHSFYYTLRGPLDLFPTDQAALAKYFPHYIRERPPDSTRTLCEMTKRYLRQHQAGGFFLWVHFMDPHAPYDPPDRFRTPLARAARSPWCLFPPHPDPGIDTNWAKNLTPQQIQLARDLYAGEIRYVDWAVGKILAELGRLGLDKSTYVIFTSDHGEELFERGRHGHGYGLYDEQVHVPLIIAGPRVLVGRTRTPVSHIDLVPTMADLVGLPRRATWRGVSLAPVLRKKTARAPERPCFAQATDFFRYKPEPQQMVVLGPYKLIRWRESKTVKLFNLDKDPNELHDVSASEPQVRDKLLHLLDKWTASFPSSFGQFKNYQQQSRTMPEDAKRVFEALGYMSAQ